MKIDDPQVQKFIQGKMSYDEEVQFREQLSKHPEVADLAETLKRTASLIEEDHQNDEKPYGLELNKISVEKLFDDDEVPKAAWARFFHQYLGKSWRFGVMILAITTGLFIFAFVIVPILRSLQEAPSTKETVFTLEDLEKRSKDSQQSQKNNDGKRNIPTHASSSPSKPMPVDLAEAFSQILDPSPQSISSQAIQVLSDIVKVSSTNGSPESAHVQQLPVSYETEIQSEIRSQIQQSQKWDKSKVQVDAFVNSFFQNKSSNLSSAIQVKSQWKSAPWDNRQILLMLEITAPILKTNDGRPFKDAKILEYTREEHSRKALIEKSFGDKFTPSFIRVEDNFLNKLDAVVEQASELKNAVILLADETLTGEQADYFLLKVSRYPHLDFVFLSLAPYLNEVHLRVRAGLQTQSRGEFYSAASPTQFQRALTAALAKERLIYQDFRWRIEFDKKFVESYQMVGSLKSPIGWEDLTPSNWLQSNDRTVVFFLMQLNPIHPDDVLAEVKASWREKRQQKVQYISVPLAKAQGTHLVSESTFQFASSAIWTGLMLSGQLSWNSEVIKNLLEQSQSQTIEPSLQEEKESFEELLEVLSHI